MRMQKTIALILMYYCTGLCWFSASGQTYNMVILDEKKGIVGPEVNDITQDRYGYIWVATNSGVGRFDGRYFINYQTVDGLAENQSSTICADRLGRIWVGHPSAGVSVIDGDSIRRVSEEHGLVNNEVHDIIQTDDGRMWIATFGGVSIMKDVFELHLSTQSGLSSNNVQCLAQDSTGNVWLGTFGSGIDIIRGGKVYQHLGHADRSRNHITSMMVEDDTVHVSTLSGCVSWNVKKLEPRFRSRLGTHQINGLARSPDGGFWTASYRGAKRELMGDFLTIMEKNGLPSNALHAAFTDEEGNVWFGSSAGLVRIGNLAYAHFDLGENVRATNVYTDDNGTLWVATNAGGVLRSEGNNFVLAFDDVDINGRLIKAISNDGQGNIWFGTADFSGLFQYDGERLSVFSDEVGLASNNINCLLNSESGNLLIGTSSGLSSYDGESFRVIPLSGSETQNVTTLVSDHDGGVYVGCSDGSLYHIGHSGVPAKLGLECPSSVVDMCYGKNGLCVATESNGVLILAKDSLVRLTQEEALDGYKAKIVEQIDSVLFIGTSRGDRIFILSDSLGTTLCRRREARYGLSFMAGAKARIGEMLWTGTSTGLFRFDPWFEHLNPVAPKTRITDLQLFFESVDWEKKGISVSKSRLPEELTLRHSDNYLRFTFSGVNHRQPWRMAYRWRMRGLETEWSPYTRADKANYQNLPPGNYTFELVACNGEGVCTDPPVSYVFTIRPPFWRTWWFYGLVTLGLLGLMYVFIKRRERTLREEKEMLTSTVAARTKELREQKEIVESQNAHITESIEYARNIQMAILPSEEEMAMAFKDHFVFYRPKETVAGDFYWVYTDGNVSWAAAVDCTGHGVGGAFMSMIGSDLLNQVIIEKRIDDPAQVLEELDKGIKLAFAQSAKEFESDQGMDVALIRVDREKRELQFAGAHRPLFLFEHDGLKEIKGYRFPISSAQNDRGKFLNHCMAFEPNDMIYLFSDGMADQFGGENGKKFMVRQLRDLLNDNHHLELHEQRLVVGQVFDAWKGPDGDQTDDVMLIGIRL